MATTASATKPPALRTRADFQIEFDFEFDLKITVNKHSKTNVKLVTTNIAKPLSMQLTVIVSTHFKSFENWKFPEIFEIFVFLHRFGALSGLAKPLASARHVEFAKNKGDFQVQTKSDFQVKSNLEINPESNPGLRQKHNQNPEKFLTEKTMTKASGKALSQAVKP